MAKDYFDVMRSTADIDTKSLVVCKYIIFELTNYTFIQGVYSLLLLNFK